MLKPGDIIKIREPDKNVHLYPNRYGESRPDERGPVLLEPESLGIVIAQGQAKLPNNDGLEVEVMVLAGTRFGWAWEHWFENA